MNVLLSALTEPLRHICCCCCCGDVVMCLQASHWLSLLLSSQSLKKRLCWKHPNYCLGRLRGCTTWLWLQLTLHRYYQGKRRVGLLLPSAQTGLFGFQRDTRSISAAQRPVLFWWVERSDLALVYEMLIRTSSKTPTAPVTPPPTILSRGLLEPICQTFRPEELHRGLGSAQQAGSG